jgi:hypothetical protein
VRVLYILTWRTLYLVIPFHVVVIGQLRSVFRSTVCNEIFTSKVAEIQIWPLEMRAVVIHDSSFQFPECIAEKLWMYTLSEISD